MSDDSLQQRFNDSIGQLLGPDFPSDIGLAVSGGGDSMAMLALAHTWSRSYGVRLWVVTVDHGLRRESAGEAAMVAAECATLGWPHATLRWHWDGQGNLQERAREARLALIDAWRGSVRHVLMAHTQDDVAETFLMRLRRGSGVEGLSAMAARRMVHLAPEDRVPLTPDDVTGRCPAPAQGRRPGFWLVRPLLGETRDDLRFFLRTLQVPWADDSSNANPDFERVRMRRLLEQMARAGLDTATLAATATRMARAREALHLRARDAGQGILRHDWSTGDILIQRDGFAAIEPDTQLRLLAHALQWVASQNHRPRSSALQALLDAALAGGGGTLHGCELVCGRMHLHVFREYAAVSDLRATVGQDRTWDRRWDIAAPDLRGLRVQALGQEGWLQIEPRPENGPGFRAARALPAVFDGARLVACAGLEFGPTGVFRLRPRIGGFGET